MSKLNVDEIVKSAIEKSDNVTVLVEGEKSVLICERLPTKMNPFGGKAEYPIPVEFRNGIGPVKVDRFKFVMHPKTEPHIEQVVRGVFTNDNICILVEPLVSNDKAHVNGVYIVASRMHAKSKDPTTLKILAGVKIA